MKKIFIAFLLTFCMNTVFSVGIGPAIDFTTGVYSKEAVIATGLSCSIKTDNIPLSIYISTDYSFIQHTFDSSIQTDYWLFNPFISSNCSFYTGLGESAGASISKDDSAFILGTRAVFGFNWIHYDGFLEYFIQAAIQPTGRFGKETEFLMEFPVNAGIRYYF